MASTAVVVLGFCKGRITAETAEDAEKEIKAPAPLPRPESGEGWADKF